MAILYRPWNYLKIFLAFMIYRDALVDIGMRMRLVISIAMWGSLGNASIGCVRLPPASMAMSRVH